MFCNINQGILNIYKLSKYLWRAVNETTLIKNRINYIFLLLSN